MHLWQGIILWINSGDKQVETIILKLIFTVNSSCILFQKLLIS
jgi:hypothetical protein